MDKLPPPAQCMYNDTPDYYQGCLLYYDDLSEDNCRWVVYDGRNKIRCPTRSSALDYIATHRLSDDSRVTQLLLSARLHINKACTDLHKAYTLQPAGDGLLYEEMSARLRPLLVTLDNKLL